MQFRKDVNALDLRPYDLVISDFEPVISHAAHKCGIPLVGIGHQYAFGFNIPKAGTNPVVNYIMKQYAPVTTPVGLHWHHFDFPILPPIIDIELPETMPEVIMHKVIVYLPFESLQEITEAIRPLDNFEFYIYHPSNRQDADDGHLHYRVISREGFKNDLLNAGKVITNSGFELISECLQTGKNILSKPLHGQMEQLSNARALQELGYADVMQKLDRHYVADWLTRDDKAIQLDYPDVAGRLARWIAGQCSESVEELACELRK